MNHLSAPFTLSLALLIHSAPCCLLAQTNNSNDAAISPPQRQEIAIQDRPGLLDGPDSPMQALRQRGMDMTLTYTEFGQGLVAGEGNQSWRFGGKMLGKVVLDGSRLYLWKGFSINLTGELNNGVNVNGTGGTILIKNAALALPQDGGTGGDLSLNFTQKFGEKVSLSIGKFDMINFPSRTPILGGGGLDTFWNIALAAPPSGVLPPYMTGGTLNVSTKPASFTFMLYDPSNAQQKAGISGWGTRGITGRISARFPAKLWNRQGFHTVGFATSSQTGSDLEDIPQLILPPESGGILNAKRGYYFGSYAVQQYFRQDKTRPGSGWGMFGQVSISDANPNPLAGNLLAGLGGTGFFRKRPFDRAGIGYFHYYISDALKRGLENTINFRLGDEQGMEAFYNFAVMRWFRVAADLQVLEPGARSFDTEVYAGMSTQVRF